VEESAIPFFINKFDKNKKYTLPPVPGRFQYNEDAWNRKHQLPMKEAFVDKLTRQTSLIMVKDMHDLESINNVFKLNKIEMVSKCVD
jgi:hypothetical protein